MVWKAGWEEVEMSKVRRISDGLDTAIRRVRENYKLKGLDLSYSQASQIIAKELRRNGRS